MNNIDKHIKDIEINGYSIIKNALNKKEINKYLNLINKEYAKLNKKKKLNYPGTPNRDKNDKILYNLYNLDFSLIELLSHKIIRSIGIKKLNDKFYRFLPLDLPNFCLSYYNARSSGDKLDLHIDSHIPYKGDFISSMQFSFLLEDSLIENGCTIVVPKSHQSGKYTNRKSNRAIPIEGRAGDLIIWDSRLWHGTLENKINKSRWAIIMTLSMWWVKPSIDITRSVKQKIYSKCNNEQKQMLGFCSLPPVNIFKRSNTKTDYNFFKKKLKDYSF